jgi:hypothetical protein
VSKALLGVAAALIAGCGGSTLREPTGTEQPKGGYAPVPYPPPAAFVELVPEAPDDAAVWVDGSWNWVGARYVWRRGGWVKPPAGSRFAQWRISYRSDGTMWFAPAAWFDANGRKLVDPDIVLPARTPANELTSEELQSGQ